MDMLHYDTLGSQTANKHCSNRPGEMSRKKPPTPARVTFGSAAGAACGAVETGRGVVARGVVARGAGAPGAGDAAGAEFGVDRPVCGADVPGTPPAPPAPAAGGATGTTGGTGAAGTAGAGVVAVGAGRSRCGLTTLPVDEMDVDTDGGV